MRSRFASSRSPLRRPSLRQSERGSHRVRVSPYSANPLFLCRLHPLVLDALVESPIRPSPGKKTRHCPFFGATSRSSRPNRVAPPDPSPTSFRYTKSVARVCPPRSASSTSAPRFASKCGARRCPGRYRIAVGASESTDVAPGHERLRRPDVRAFARGFALKHARGTRAHLTQLRLAVFHPRASPRGGGGDDGAKALAPEGGAAKPGPSAEAAESIDAAAAHNAGPRAAVVMMSPTSLVQPA